MIFFFIVAFLATLASAWGPISHVMFNCWAAWPHLGSASAQDCLQFNSPKTVSLGVGSDMPDALAFGRFNISGQAPRSRNECQNLAYMHSPAFGAFQVQRALAAPSTGAFNALAFSIGFLGHTVGDISGFFPHSIAGRAAGILCGDHIGSCAPTGVLYVPMWGLMNLLDSLVYANQLTGLLPAQIPTVASNGREAVQWVANASIAYSQIDPTFSPQSESAIQQCVDFWQGNQQWDYELAAFKASQPNGLAAIQAELAFYLTQGPPAPFTNYFAKNSQCAIDAVAAAVKDALNGVSPSNVMARAKANVQSFYQMGKCS